MKEGNIMTFGDLLIKNNTTVYKLSNGTLVSFSKANGARSAYVYMDVNGIAGPNIAGRDIFVVRIFSDGIVRGNCSNYLNDCTAKGISEGMNFEKEQAQANLDYYQNEPLESWETQEDRNRDIQWATEEVAKYSNLGSYVQELSDNCLQPYSYDNWRETCSFRLMNNGWKMDY